MFEGNKKLPIVETFYSIQGEGFHTGKPVYFIRIGGCYTGCYWCDSKNTWNPKDHSLMYISDIKSKAHASPAKAILVTGGEPTLYNLKPLCKELSSSGKEIYLETSGTGELTGSWDWICLSPKSHAPPNGIFYRVADELKVIVCKPDDLEWAEKAAHSVEKGCKLYLQPEWSQFCKMIPHIIDYVKKYPEWNVSVQMHKFMRIP